MRFNKGMRDIQVAALLHVNVEVTDIERALAFYRIFGLEEIERLGAPTRAGAWFRFPNGCELHLSQGPAHSPARAHFAILVDDLEAARAAVLDAGAPIEHEREIPNVARFFTRDPDGNRIEVSQRLG
jgi:catechol 2,3-dioxygenase-like lactoylglutathione lyase family enzyme